MNTLGCCEKCNRKIESSAGICYLCEYAEKYPQQPQIGEVVYRFKPHIDLRIEELEKKVKHLEDIVATLVKKYPQDDTYK